MLARDKRSSLLWKVVTYGRKQFYNIDSRSIGVEVRVLEADEAFPDCVFVEDPAIVIEGQT
jgi:hypothetical protein